ncbi:inorganic anion transporter, SulP family [Ancylostoma duodenale]|uniref:Inorganic anion transporter, SulP family n=1 Tax=Ancylostoma duodenale TaxID=51022 RepID=A0A0C2GAX7_9BILA|nr:inorganic anion transporter, SulP family [Ancylostoma duodenale]
MHVPQGIAYALLAGVDPVIGLYTSFFPVLAYMLFGTSRHTSTGTFAVVALMTGKAVIRLSVQPSDDGSMTNMTMPDGPTPVQVASALTVLMGVIQAAVAGLGLDFVTKYFSDELVGGFTTGASMHVFITQFKDITGIYGLPRRDGPANALLKVYDLCRNIPRANLMTLGMSAVTMLVLILGKDLVNPLVQKRCPVPIPFELLAAAVAVLGLDFVTTYFSDELVGGFTTGASMHVFITQFKDITGIYGLPRRDGPANALLKVYDLCRNIPRANLMTLGMSAVTMLVLILGKDLVNPLVQKRCPVPIPFELLAVIAGTLVCQFAQLNQKFNVRTVGEIPTGNLCDSTLDCSAWRIPKEV